jgi:hypothetical protein
MEQSMKVLSLIILALVLVGCSSSNGPENTPVFNASYFPHADGDTWYYTASNSEKITRVVDGDTVINGLDCIRILENGEIAEAWSIIESGDSAGFYVNMLTFVYNSEVIHPYFDPPLRIPFNMKADDEYTYDSDGYYTSGGNVYTFTAAGTLKFEGFIEKDVPAGNFKDVARIYYVTDNYNEYYAKGVGLLDNEDYVLDSAFIGGKWYK